MKDSATPPTRVLSVREEVYYIRRFALSVLSGPDRGKRILSSGDELSIGTDEGNDLRLTDSAVSRHHAVLRATERGLLLSDLASTNGTFVGECELSRGFVRSGAQIDIGRTRLAVEVLSDEIGQPMSSGDSFGALIGASPEMRRLFPLLERCSESSATVLITGETGTGKEVVAEAVHQKSDRGEQPFVIVDCGALPRQLMESELFGHARGAFTGADVARVGAFEAANGGTVFLDEIGELALERQPVLLRVLESRRFRPVGGEKEVVLDVRIIAATNRDLRIEVNEKRFRADLYFRLNVLRVELPPLRQRVGDAELLAKHFWQAFRPGVAAPAELLATVRASSWPGNVRELRNLVERTALVGPQTIAANEPQEHAPYSEAKEGIVSRWERDYLAALLTRTSGNLSHAAKAAKTSRSHLRLLMQRHGIEREDFTK